jgi:hypothetical protein
MKIGNAGGFWGDDLEAPAKLEQSGLDYLTLDYLAELSLSIMAVQREKNPLLGYAEDFLDVAVSLQKASCKVITNAGGLNPEGLKKALEERISGKKIIAVSGDDVFKTLKSDPDNSLYRNLENNKPLKEVVDRLVSANAYLGARGIAQALKEGADIVVTGRVADPSLTVGPALFHYGWKEDDYDKIAQATVAGHLIECGTQVTGGISTAWDTLDNPWDIGYPYVEMDETGSFVITKPEGTSGRVDMQTVKEQLLYEIGDPDRYLSPDATVSFLGLRLNEEGKNRVRITGARGSPPPPSYKVSASYREGFRAEGTLLFIGGDAKGKAQQGATMILKRSTVDTSLTELFGEKDECLLRLAAFAKEKGPLEHFLRQFAPLVTSGPPGTTGYTGGRGKVRPVFGFWPCLISRKVIDG